MELKLYKCEHCGNIVYKAYDSGVPVVCCGEKMGEMKANVTDGAVEKHVPVVTKNGNEVTVTVGSVIHPMVEEHYIPIIAATNENTVVFKLPKPGQEPVLTTTLEGKVTAYEWCNLHGLWKGE
jgi:superoxide reductase